MPGSSLIRSAKDRYGDSCANIIAVASRKVEESYSISLYDSSTLRLFDNLLHYPDGIDFLLPQTAIDFIHPLRLDGAKELRCGGGMRAHQQIPTFKGDGFDDLCLFRSPNPFERFRSLRKHERCGYFLINPRLFEYGRNDAFYGFERHGRREWIVDSG